MDYLVFSIFKKLMVNLRQLKTPKLSSLSAKSISLSKSSMRSFRGKRNLDHQQEKIGGNRELTSFLRKIRTMGIIRRSANYTRLIVMMRRKRFRTFGWSFVKDVVESIREKRDKFMKNVECFLHLKSNREEMVEFQVSQRNA